MTNIKCNGSAAFDAADFVGPVVGDYDTPATIERGAVVQRNAMAQFLAALFGSKPAELFILVWLLGEKASKWFHGVDDAVAYVERRAGEDVYAGVALAPADLGPKNRCKAADTAGIVGIWLDLDYQSEAHKKDNLPPTLRATLDLIPQDLPPSIVVHSGHGVQVWWLFPDPWLFTDEADRGAAADLVRSFQALIKDGAAKNGWDVDSVFDLARVMRIPGTTNTKVQGDFRPVELLEINDRRYEPQEIRDYLARAGVVPAPPAIAPVTGSFPGMAPATPAIRPSIVGNLVLDPDAQPPFEKFDLLADIEMKFRASWEHKRTDMKDQSPSSYDQSLANYAARLRWTDQEITNLLIAHRRKHGEDLKLRQDYYKRTIATARASAEPFLREQQSDEILNQLLAEPDGDSGKEDATVQGGDHTQADGPGKGKSAGAIVDVAARREKILEALSIRFKVPLKRVLRFTGEDPRYRLETELGDVPLGNVNGLICQGKLRSSIAAATGRYLPHIDDEHWPEIARWLLEACEQRDRGDDATLTGKVTDWLRSYLGHKQPHESLEEADEGREPFLDGGDVFIFSGDLRRWLASQQGERVPPNQLTAELRAYGAEPKVFEVTKNGKVTTRSAWRLPAGLWEPDEAEQQ
jgi:hypothetical protein